MNANRYKSIDPDDFSTVPLCILKTNYINGHRCAEISVNNVVRSRKKHTSKAAELFSKGGYAMTPYHFHEGIEILRIHQGNAIVVVNGTKYPAEENDILIVNPFEDHGILLPDPKMEFSRSCLIFEPTNLFPAEKGKQNQLFYELRSLRFQNFISHKDPLNEALRTCIDEIVAQTQTHSAEWPIVVFSQLIAFYALIVKGNLIGKKDDTMPYRYEFVFKVSEYVEANLDREIRTEELANYCGYSLGHFCRLFKTCFNRSFKEYLNSCRIERAKELMETTPRLSDVYLSVGFRHANHFTNTFKKQEGISPSSYMKKMKMIKGETQ